MVREGDFEFDNGLKPGQKKSASTIWGNMGLVGIGELRKPNSFPRWLLEMARCSTKYAFRVRVRMKSNFHTQRKKAYENMQQRRKSKETVEWLTQTLCSAVNSNAPR